MDNLLIDLDRELASTRRILERYPAGKGEWQPHQKSRTLSALATHVANIPQHGANILTTAEMDVASRPPQPPKDSAAELVQIFDTGVARLKASVADTDAAKLSEKWTMRAGSRVLVSEPRALLMRLMVINHLVHHRAQLGVYLPAPGRADSRRLRALGRRTGLIRVRVVRADRRARRQSRTMIVRSTTPEKGYSLGSPTSAPLLIRRRIQVSDSSRSNSLTFLTLDIASCCCASDLVQPSGHESAGIGSGQPEAGS